MLKNIKIKSKLLILAAFTIFGLVALMLLNTRTVNNIVHLNEVKMSVEQLEAGILELRKHEKDFMLRKELKYKESFDKTITNIEDEVQFIEDFFTQKNVETKELNAFKTILKSYQNYFDQLVSIQKIIGLTPESGLYGSLRQSVHKVQESAKETKNFELLSKVYELRKEEKDFMLRSDLKYVDSFQSKIDTLIQSSFIPENLKQYCQNYKNDFLALVEKETQLGLKSDLGINGQMRATIHETEDSIQNLVKEIDTFIETSSQQTKTINLVISFLIILIMIAFIVYLSKNINQLLTDFQEGLLSFFRYLNKEENHAKLIPIESKDEFGIMSGLVNENIKKIQTGLLKDNEAVNEALSVVEQAIRGHLDVRLHKIANNPELKALAEALNQMLTGIKNNVDSISTVLKEFSNYKFVNTVSTDGLEGDMLELIKSVNFLTKEISELLKTSLNIGLTLDDASNQLIVNVDILNQSSNEAAASLEETAAALEEITSTIVNNSENVTKMSNYAKELTASATKGQALAQNTTTAMDEITQQVMAISDAITVIDQIAFQTNILSLNAAVEAATAGESGKGFAVVAQEVRNLASRSAEAAKEIKDLVENATKKTSHGKTISSDMIQGYKSLLENIKQSTQMITEIANASKEQEAGITQINDAVTQLDQQTQQNASIASQTHDIAMQTDKIAKDIVEDANKKEFLGKESIPTKKNTPPLKSLNSPTKSIQDVKISKTTPNPSSHKDAVWESF